MQNIVKGVLSTFSFANPLLKDHDLGPLITSSLAWKIYSGVKRGTNEPVAIFESIFDKRNIEKYPKPVQESICAIIKKDATSLSKLRHPSILRVLSPLEETKSDMVFITEPILYTLRMLCSSPTLSRMDLVEVKKCAYDITDGLYFLHEAAKMVHRRICPDTIFCTDKGEWKIGGFGFSYPVVLPDPPLDVREIQSNPSQDVFQFSATTEFLAPEMMTGLIATTMSDVYALGRLALYMMAHTDDVADPISESGKSESDVYRNRIDRLQIDHVRAEFLRPLLIHDPHLRCKAESFLRSGYFQDTNTRVLLFLKNFVQQDDSNKLQFLKGLQNSVHTFSPRIICQHVLPSLLLEIKNDKLAAPVLKNVFLSSQSISHDEFNKIVVPQIVSLYKATTVLSHAVLIVLLENLAIAFNKSKPDIGTNFLIGFLVRALSTNKIDVIAEALIQLPSLIGNPAMTMEAIRSGVLPRLQYICQNANSEQLRVNTLVCFAKLVPIIERYLTLEFVMPSLTHLSQSDRSLPISVALITVYEVVVQQFDAELLAQKLLPSLLPLSVDKDINLDQFKVVMRVVRMAIDKLEQSRLDELSKRKIDAVVPLAESANQNEWETFEQAQQRLMASPSSQKATPPSLSPASSPSLSPSPTPATQSSPQLFASMPPKQSTNTPKPTPLNSSSPSPSLSPIITAQKPVSQPTTPRVTTPTYPIAPPHQINHSPIIPLQPPSTSTGNLFAGLETKKPPMNASIKSNNSDPFGGLGELSEQMKKRPATLPPKLPPPSNNSFINNAPLIPSFSNSSIMSPTPISPSPSPSLSPTPFSANTPNFNLAGLNINSQISSPQPLQPELFSTNLNNFMDL